MKGNLYRTSRIKHKYVTRVLYYGIASIAVFFLLQWLILGTVAYVHIKITSFTNWIFNSTNSLPAYFRDRSDLLESIQNLESELAAHSGDQQTIANLSRERLDLLQLLGAHDDERVVANVQMRPPFAPYDTFVVDKGIEDGVTEGAVVFVQNDKAIGHIIHASAYSSVVQLVSTPGVRSTVYVIGSNIYTDAVGIGGGVLQVNLPQGVRIAVGDLVVAPALGSGIYGSVEEVVSVPTEPIQAAFVTTNSSLQSIRTVSVSINNRVPVDFETAAAAVATASSSLQFVVPEELFESIEATSTQGQISSNTIESL